MRAKTLAVLVVLTCAAAACGGEQPPPPQPPPPPAASLPPPPPTAATSEAPPAPPKPAMTDLIPQTIKNISDAFNAHDSQKFAANFAPDVVCTTYGMPDMHGREDMAKGLQSFLDVSSDVKGGVGRAFAKGNLVCIEW